jgi:hypothetical protein
MTKNRCIPRDCQQSPTAIGVRSDLTPEDLTEKYELTDIQPELVTDPHDHPHLRTERRWKRVSDHHIVPSILDGRTDRQLKLADRLLHCSTVVQLSDKGIEHTNRCKSRLCPNCAQVEANDWKRRITRAVNIMPFNVARHAVLQITLNAGEACLLSDLRSTLKCLSKLWPRLLNTAHLRARLEGAFRATEVTVSNIDGAIRANPHIHGVLILNITEQEDIEAIVASVESHIKRYWPKAVKAMIAKHRPAPDVRKSVIGAEELYSRSKADLERWMHYCTKGLVLELAREHGSTPPSKESGELWTTLEHALHCLRLTSSHGIIKEALAEAEIPIEPGISDETTESAQKIYIWSRARRTYIPRETFNPHTDTPPDWISSNLPHTYQPYLLHRSLRLIERRLTEGIEQRQLLRMFEHMRAHGLLPPDEH